MRMNQGSLPDGVLRLDELQILVVVDNETDTLSSVDEGLPQIPKLSILRQEPLQAESTKGMTARLCLISSAAPVTDSLC